MNQDGFHKMISGQSKGSGAAILRPFLAGVAKGYSAIIGLRNFLYSNGYLKRVSAEAAVISIGNITVGGTGKTPLVIWLCNLLQQKDVPCAILTRGYKTEKGILYDEPAVLAKSCVGAKVIVNADRAAGASEAINEYGAKVLIMDDGFQHRCLKRNLDIVAIDSTCPFGYGRLLPAGLLREPVTSLKRADAVVITRCDQSSEDELAGIERKLRSVNPKMAVARSVHYPTWVKSLYGRKISAGELKGQKVFAFCGIGNPGAFFEAIRKLGVNVVGTKIYNDHYYFTQEDVAEIYELGRRSKADLILSTQKDWTKTALMASVKKDILFAYLAVELKFTSGEDKLKRLIEEALAGKILQK